mmetsp:Transcript_92523/g.160754  ORF Transcript_92523/g.160754 Transcript_92523/m.160754 type:complete len:109 (-) Transcript_92523:639-965(-)
MIQVPVFGLLIKQTHAPNAQLERVPETPRVSNVQAFLSFGAEFHLQDTCDNAGIQNPIGILTSKTMHRACTALRYAFLHLRTAWVPSLAAAPRSRIVTGPRYLCMTTA